MTDLGYTVWRGRSPYDKSPIVCIVTMRSSNRKTGDMAQMWILREDIPPLEANMYGHDTAICGDCPLQGMMSEETGRKTGRACYVNLGQAPASVYKAYIEGKYVEDLRLTKVKRALKGRGVRLGAYGDPGFVPLSVLKALTGAADMWTGYTHTWKYRDPRYSDYLMASVETEDDLARARDAGWRSFMVSDEQPEGSVICAADRDVNPLQCVDCGMCAGTRNGTVTGAVDIWIRPHGSGKKYLNLTIAGSTR